MEGGAAERMGKALLKMSRYGRLRSIAMTTGAEAAVACSCICYAEIRKDLIVHAQLPQDTHTDTHTHTHTQ